MSTRRAAIAGAAAAAAVTVIPPALGKALRGASDPNDIDTQLEVLFEQFHRDARIIDPTITGAWIMRDLVSGLPGRSIRGVVSCISFQRGEPVIKRRRP